MARRKEESEMTDRELLEMAAKAFGIKTSTWHEIEHPKNSGIYGAFYCYDSYWNPLTDDGDALRLAASIPSLSLQWIIAEAWQANNDQASRMGYVRRAIVRAAAAIGSEM